MINNFDDSEVECARTHIEENGTHTKTQTSAQNNISNVQ